MTKFFNRSLAILLGATFLVSTTAISANAANVIEQRRTMHKAEDDTLARLYAMRPDTRAEIQSAVGYAVFSSGSLAIIWVSGGYGCGIAHDNRNGQDIYMQTAHAGLGLGLGAKDFSTIFVFHDAKSFHDFTTTGIDLTGAADATAQVGSKGGGMSGAADVMPGVRIYQLTDTGLLAQAMLQGTKYWRDNALNGTAVNQ